jgi:hypothetical protein
MERSGAGKDKPKAFAESVYERLGEYFHRCMLSVYIKCTVAAVLTGRHVSPGRADLAVKLRQLTFVIGTKDLQGPCRRKGGRRKRPEADTRESNGAAYRDPIPMSIALDLDLRNSGHCFIQDTGVMTPLAPDGRAGLAPAMPVPEQEA